MRKNVVASLLFIVSVYSQECITNVNHYYGCGNVPAEKKLAKTCSDLHGVSSGYYWIAPDPARTQPIYVYCNMSGHNGAAVTTIAHDAIDEETVTKCEAAGCYKRPIKYSGTLKQVAAVIDASQHCRQFIKYRCQSSVVFYYPQSPYGWWVARDGNQRLYWGGATSRRDQYCACAEDGTCDEPDKRCNCDKNNAPETSDEGYLVYKADLPVTQLVFGDTDQELENGWHTLGPIECWN